METQRDRVLAMLREGPVCSTTFLINYIPRAAARILELREQGYVIRTRTCRDLTHRHNTRQVEYVLLRDGLA